MTTAVQLEQPVRQDQAEELAELPGVGEQPARQPDVGAVEHQQGGGGHAQQRAGGEGGERHLDVVDGDLGGELRGRLGRVVGLEVLLEVGLAQRLGGGGVERLVVRSPASTPTTSAGTSSSAALTATKRPLCHTAAGNRQAKKSLIACTGRDRLA